MAIIEPSVAYHFGKEVPSEKIDAAQSVLQRGQHPVRPQDKKRLARILAMFAPNVVKAQAGSQENS